VLPREYAFFGELTDPTYTTDDDNWSRIRDNTGAAARPIYWIEVFSYGPASERFLYRITVEATGRNPSSVVRLQEIYEPAL
jgi:Tfp pilus assembly protein PilX